MVCHDRLTEWAAHPRRSAPSIVDDRILTSCAVVCARMDGWWTLAAGTHTSHRLFKKGRARRWHSRLDPEARSHGSITCPSAHAGPTVTGQLHSGPREHHAAGG